MRKIVVLDAPDGKGKDDWQKYFSTPIDYFPVSSLTEVKQVLRCFPGQEVEIFVEPVDLSEVIGDLSVLETLVRELCPGAQLKSGVSC